jgi:hypothetical protein
MRASGLRAQQSSTLPRPSALQRLLDGGQIYAVYTCNSLAVFEDEEYRLDATLVFFEQWNFVEGSGSELQILVLDPQRPQRRLDALARAAPRGVRFNDYTLQTMASRDRLCANSNLGECTWGCAIASLNSLSSLRTRWKSFFIWAMMSCTGCEAY